MAYDTIIVGGGICGLTAADILAAQGQNVLVLEAQDYFGGRIKSAAVDNGKLHIDLGAHWFHGAHDNPLFEWASKNFTLGPVTNDSPTERYIFTDGKKDITGEVVKCRNRLNEIYNTMAAKRSDDFTLADVIKAAKSPKAAALIHFKTQLWMAGSDPAHISVREMIDDPLGPGGMQMEKGVSHLIDQMVIRLIRKGVTVFKNAPVAAVENIRNGVRVEMRDGRVFRADHAIATPSIGVLKSGAMRLDSMTQARLSPILQGLYMGSFFKPTLCVDEEYFIKKRIHADQPVGVINDNNPVFIHARTGGKPFVTVAVGGAQAQKLEGQSTASIKKFAVTTLEATPVFSGIKKYIRGDVLEKKWGSTPETLGPYTLKRPDYERSDPFQSGRIIFAGEAWVASVKDSPGQMAGAWKSASRATGLILG